LQALDAGKLDMDQSETGRLIDHLGLRVRDLAASRRFYRACVEALGLRLTGDEPGYFAIDELYVDLADDGGQGPVSHVHLAFQAADRAAVDRFHAAGLAAGGRDNGAPGERDYHPGYYGAFLLDPDGNNIEAVHHGSSGQAAAAPTQDPA
jgi:catechol 2,3-dioxygenase-like lactoylglutathione lyase family enzyme